MCNGAKMQNKTTKKTIKKGEEIRNIYMLKYLKWMIIVEVASYKMP